MPTQVTNYQCPACTGPLHYSAKSGKLACDYCGSSFDVAEIEALYARKEAEAAAAKQAADAKAEAAQAAKAEAAEAAAASGGWDTSDLSRDWGAEADGLRVYSCPSCGAELICDQSTAATACPYCGNPAIVPGQFSGALRPDYILPFRLSKDDAVQALRAHYKGKPFLPRSFTSANHIEQIQGVYVPFWLFDGGAEGAASYRASNTNVFETGDYEITETRHYHVVRAGSLAFEKIPVDASSKMPDDHMDSIEPFDYAQLRPFSTAYLPGYLADKYDHRRQPRPGGHALPRDARAGPARHRHRLRRVRDRARGHRAAARQGALRPAAGLDAEHEVARAGLPLRHERPDRQARRRPADGPRPLLGHVRRHRGPAHGGADCNFAVPAVRRRRI